MRERLEKNAPASAPAAGPDSRSWIGTRLASSIWVKPPFDSIMNSGAGDAERGDLAAHQIEITGGQRLDEGVGDRGRAALELADLRRHLAGQRHRQVGEMRGDQPAGLELVRRIGIGMQEHHGQRLGALALELADPREQAFAVERRLDRAGRADTLVDLEPQAARHQRRRQLDEQIVELVFILAPQLERVTEARGGDQPGRRPLRSISAFENNVVAWTTREIWS